VGKRLFPETLVIGEPFVEDELSLPLFRHIRRPPQGDRPRTLETQIMAEFKKRLTPNLELSVGSGLTHLDPDGKPTLTGFDNLEVGLKYQCFRSEAHEALLSLGLAWEVGGTGRKATGAESFDVVNPALLFGKGFGDLPEALPFLKPLAVTGVLGGKIPTRASTRKVRVEVDEVEIERHPNIFQWGFVVEYSLPYLQSFVKDLGLPAPFNRAVPVVELSFETFLDRGSGGKTNGTINPGIIWAGEFFQLGFEVIFPVNDRTGKNLGIRGLLRFSLDELFPGLGQPLFVRQRAAPVLQSLRP